MPKRNLEQLLLEDRRIIFRNFSGAEGRYNAKGDRNFHVLLEDDEAEAMLRDGWNVKYLQPREEDDKPQAHLIVTVKYGRTQPPRIILISSKGKTALDESMIDLLDWAEPKEVDMILNPYQWEVNGKSGVKAYLKALYFTIVEDALELKYADVPDSAASSIMITSVEEDEHTPIQARSEILSITRGSNDTPF